MADVKRIDTRMKNVTWRAKNNDGSTTYEQAHTALLMDVRDELQGIRHELALLNGLMNCRNTIAIPQILRKIAKNTTKKPRRPRAPGGT